MKENPKPEIRNPNPAIAGRNSKSETGIRTFSQYSSFGFRIYFEFRISNFEFQIA